MSKMKHKFAYGVDLGWVSQLEARGISWVDEQRQPVDPILAVKQMGADAVRLRVFVNPPAEGYWKKTETETCMLGFCDMHSVLAVAKRVKAAQMRLMIDIHYSDHFADPLYQDIPQAWKNDSAEALAERVYEHTKEVLTLLTDHDIHPEWVQVGNEINPGILLPHGGWKEHPDQLVAYLNAGYDAVKACCPDCQVVTHLAGVHSKEWCFPFLDSFFAHGGRTDILGFSYYPYWFKIKSDRQFLYECLKELHDTYQKPVLIAEVGGEETDEEGTCQLLSDTVEATQMIDDGQGVGVFYWEPDVGAALLPDKYPLGAARLLDEHTLQYTKAVSTYKKYN